MIENALSCEVILPGLFRLKLKAYQGERFPWNHSNAGKDPEGLGRVLENLEIDRGVACVHYLDSLISGVIHPCWRKHNFVRGTNFDHWNERLGPRRERVTNQPHA